MIKKVKSSHLHSDSPLSNSKKYKSQELSSPIVLINSDYGQENIITRFKKNAPICGICYISIEKQVNQIVIIFYQENIFD